MFKTSIRIDECSNIDVISTSLRQKAKLGRLDDREVIELINEFTKTATPLIESCRAMKVQGSSVNITRNIKGLGYEVKLEFATSNSKSLFGRVMNLFSGH